MSAIATTLADARASDIPRILNVCPEHDKVREYTNRAQRKALIMGRWWRSYQVIQICVTDGCATWPRQVAHVEKVDVCNQPIPVKNAWWEFLEYSAGYRDGNSCGELMAVPRGTVPMFSDILGINKVLRVYPMHPTDVGKRILFQGNDQNGIWIRTQETPGVWVDGFWITLALPYVDSPMVVSSITGVPKKDVTVERVYVYEHDTLTGSDRPLAVYEPGETTPNYVRSLLTPLGSGGCKGQACTAKSVTALVKLAYIPAVSDLDFLIIGNIDALEHMVQALKYHESGMQQEAITSEKLAKKSLNDELRTYTGDKTSIGVSIFGSAPFSRVTCGFR